MISLRAPDQHPQGIGRQWYGLFPPDWMQVPDAINSLQIRVKSLSTQKINLEKTVILGFSQGGAMALASGSNLPVAGIIACSAYPHPNWNMPSKMPPILLTHGKNDEVVPFQAMEKINQLLKEQNFEVDAEMFDGGHEIPLTLVPRIMESLEKWLIN